MSLRFYGSPVPRSTHWPFCLSVCPVGAGLSYCSTRGVPAEMEKRQLRVKVRQQHLLWGVFVFSGSSLGPAGIRAAGPESKRGRVILDVSPEVVLALGCRISYLSNHPFILPPFHLPPPPSCTYPPLHPPLHPHSPFIHHPTSHSSF